MNNAHTTNNAWNICTHYLRLTIPELFADSTESLTYVQGGSYETVLCFDFDTPPLKHDL